jgi:epoxyqueuosine reductase QueG
MDHMGVEENFERVRALLGEEAGRHGLKEAMGVAPFSSVYKALIPVQRVRLRKFSGDSFDELLKNGSIVSIAFAYPEHAVDSIAVGSEGNYDRERWNVYAREYMRLNEDLNETSARIASEIGGVAIPATSEGIAAEISCVEDYYPLVVSHRVAAEQSGVGWRGKNELIVNPRFSCAIRLASVLTTLPLRRTPSTTMGCGDCRACLDVCPYLRNKEELQNYREQCRRYLVHLGLVSDVCGKCVKACYRDSVYRDQFKL